MREKIMVVDDEPNLLRTIRATLEREGYEVHTFEDFELAKSGFQEEDYCAVLTDLAMPRTSGIQVLEYCRERAPDVPVIILTAHGTVETAVTALKLGAFDFVLKPFDSKDLVRILETSIQSRKRRVLEPHSGVLSATGLGPIPFPLFGDQPSTLALRTHINSIVLNRSHVWIEGEVGTGHRNIAHQIHRQGGGGPIVHLQMDAIPPAFQLSEIFGMEKGATPTAFVSKPGKLELANRGSLIIEGIQAMTVEVQNALDLAITQESFTRLGGIESHPIDLRMMVLCSGNFLESNFHPDLLHRLSVERIRLVPLRERRADLQSHLIPYFVERACRKRGIANLPVSTELMIHLLELDWTGNFMELENRLESLVNQESGTRLRLPSAP